MRVGQRLILAVVPAIGPYPDITRIIENVTAGDKAGAQWLFNWMARLVQRPGARSMVAVVLQGAHGTGKDTLGWVLAEILGRKNVASISQADLDGNFNGHFVSKLLVIADEVVNRDNIRDTASILKKYVTDPRAVANSKNVKQYEIENRMSWWFTSNAPTPVRLEGTDRRYTVFCQCEPPSEEYKQVLSSLYNIDGTFTEDFKQQIVGFAHALANHHVDHTMATRPYENEDRADLMKASQSVVEAFIEEVKERGIDDMLKTYNIAETFLDDWDVHGGGVPVDMVYRALCEFGPHNGFQGMPKKQVFGKEVKQKNPGWARVRTSGKGRPWVYTGVPRTGMGAAAT